MIKHTFDLSDFISTFVKDENGNTYSLSNMLKVFNVEFKGTQHNAYADALNLAYLYDAFLKNRSVVKDEYKKVLFKMRHLPTPIQNLITKLSKGESVSPDDFDALIEDSIK